MAASNGKRPFWMHQLVEYIMGGVLVAQGLQSPTPTVPAVMGGVVMLNAACAQGSLSAFSVVPMKAHRVLDICIAVAVVLMGVQPWVSVENGVRAVMVLVGVVLGFVCLMTNYTVKPKRTRKKGQLSEDIGRAAGRAVGDGINAGKRHLKKR